ncbi:DUF881 domain-containing protein [Actinocatenispora sera]|uniref:Membrane protein n=1 Tax=Actinocatenispora sera TaxID=390989 RepID=A0A810L4N3_9ACTN|nr:DUF881 domain-containing protein [Actinocatenispora sera]BCJ30520.1 membrane protein [Actinocatenispora sera]
MSDPLDPPKGEPAGPGPTGRTWGKAFGADLLARLYETSLEPGYAAAAEKRRREGPQRPFARRLGKAGTAAMALLFGVLMAVTYRHAVAAEPESHRTHDQLVGEVKSQRADTDALQRRADRLRAQVSHQRDEALSLAGGDEADRLHALEAANGLDRVRGPGLTVTLTDAPTPKDPVTGKESSENLGRVLDVDIQEVVNELWRDGAEAVAVDGQRLGATSTIRTAGEAILVDFRPVNSPYKITVIGPGSMGDRFGSSATDARYEGFVKRYQMGFAVQRSAQLTLPAAADQQLRYAHPVRPGGSASPSSSPSASGTGGGR